MNNAQRNCQSVIRRQHRGRPSRPPGRREVRRVESDSHIIGALKGSAQSRSDWMGTVGIGGRVRGGPGATANGSQGRGTRAVGSTREKDDREILPGPKPYSTAGCAAPAAAAVFRRVRVEMRPEGGSATGAYVVASFYLCISDSYFWYFVARCCLSLPNPNPNPNPLPAGESR